MSVIRVKRVGGFLVEGDVVLLAVDADGLLDFREALADARRHGRSRLPRAGRVHEFVVENGASDVDLGADRVVWRLDAAKAEEIAALCESLGADGRPGHQHVDGMRSPADTLVLSIDEYLSPNWLTAGRQPVFTDDDPD